MQYQKDTGYPALEKMQRQNADKYKQVIEKLDIDRPLPYIPPVHTWRRTNTGGKPIDKTDMEFCAADFIRNKCEGLGYDLNDIKLDDLDGDSAGKGQIPKAMEWDLNRLCLENAIHVFVESGLAEDAFDIYFCYLEMFIGEYSKSGKLIEQVAEFEQNASSLLMKHRDHYSHSVYVFLIGLAIYDTNPAYRKAFEDFYGIKNEHEAAYKFLKFWGLTALFHDTGYPFEIPYEQVKAYFTKSELIGERNSDDDQKNWPFLSYQNMDWFIDLDSFDVKSSLWKDLMPVGYKDSKQETVDDILAANVAYRLEKHYSSYDKFREYSQNSGASYTDYMSGEILGNKPGHPEKFNDFMDHGYWSATVLFSQLVNILDEDEIRKNSQMYMDSLTAVLLHNSIYKFCVTCYKDNKEFKDGLRAEWHPLAFLLFLCDELQAWDHTAYGQNSRSEVHAMDCDFEFNGKTVIAKYVVDQKLKDKVGAKIEGNEKFQKDIEMILYINKDDTDSESVLTLDCDTIYRENDRYRKRYLSSSNYIHLFDFALILNERYCHSQQNGQSTADFIRELEHIKREDMLKNFEGMSLEYKLSNIKQAKGFARYLDKIGCFYTDSPVDFEILDRFSGRELALIGPMENNRWLKEKAYLGWSPNCIGISYADQSITAAELDEKIKTAFKGNKKEYKKFREQTRCHNLMVPVRYDQNGMLVFIHGKDTERHYDLLSPYDKSLDREPMNVIFHLMNNFDGLRIYRYRDTLTGGNR